MRLAHYLLILCPLANLASQQIRPEVPVNPSGSLDSIFSYAVAASGDHSVIVYVDDEGPRERVLAARSNGAGLSWSSAVRVDRDTTGSSKQISPAPVTETSQTTWIAGDSVYATWIDLRNSTTSAYSSREIFFNRSLNGGRSFEVKDQRIDTGFPPGMVTVDGYAMAIVPDPGGNRALDRIHILESLHDPATGVSYLYLVTSTDGGASFGPTIPISTVSGTGAYHFYPFLAVSGSRVICAWFDDRDATNYLSCFSRASADGGQSFSPEVLVQQGFGYGTLQPQIDVVLADDGLAAIVFAGEPTVSSEYSVFVVTSADYGQTWGEPTVVRELDYPNETVSQPNLILTAQRLVTAFVANLSGVNEIYSSYSDDTGATWSPVAQISQTGTVIPSAFPIFFDGSGAKISLLWNGNGASVFGANSFDAGSHFSNLPDTIGDFGFLWDAAYNSSNDNVLVGNTFFMDLRVGGFSLCGPSSVTSRNAGTNPMVFTASDPILGLPLTLCVDATNTGYPLTAVVGYRASRNTILQGGQVLLVDPTDSDGELLGLAPMAGPTATYVLAVPNDPSLCEHTVFTQALLLGGAQPFQLTNSQDLKIAAY